jgi:hypothetical protein
VAERERQLNAERSHEKDLHEMEKREAQLRNQLVQVESLNHRLQNMRKEIADLTAKAKASCAMSSDKPTSEDTRHRQ